MKEITVYFTKTNGQKANQTFKTFTEAMERLIKDDVDKTRKVSVLVNYNGKLSTKKGSFDDVTNTLFNFWI